MHGRFDKALRFAAFEGFSAARAPVRTRRFVLPAALMTAISAVALLWLHPIHGALSASWATATGAHSGTTLTVSIPPIDACINGHVVKDVPLVWSCFGRVGRHPDEYYRGYYATLSFLYGSLPEGTDCNPSRQY